MKRFVTFHILINLPSHNLNRDGNGQPKSQFDGGGSAQPNLVTGTQASGRVAFRDADGIGSVRTKYGAEEVVDIASRYATDTDKDFDPKRGLDVAKKLVTGLATDKQDAKDTVLLFSKAELTSLAHAIVNAQNGDEEPTTGSFIKDAASPSLDVAAFGRMFAQANTLSTLAAVAVSPAIGTHKMMLTTDYFIAAEDLAHHNPAAGAGAAHLGMSFLTSGTYYRTFTVDVDQLKRSWSGFGGDGAEEAIASLLKALTVSLPTGKVNATNAHSLPFVVVVEEQDFRSAYSFETPVTAGGNGGYSEASIEALSEQQSRSHAFSPENFGATYVVGSDDLIGEPVSDIDTLVSLVAANIANG